MSLASNGRQLRRRLAWTVAACLALQLPAAWLVARAWRGAGNTLLAGERWVSTKTELERGVIGAWAFVTERRALAGGELDLSAWHGFNEVRTRRTFADLEEVRVEFDLDPQSWLLLRLHADDAPSATGWLLSALPARESTRVEVGSDGEFLASRPLTAAQLEAGRHVAHLLRTATGYELRIDGAVAYEASGPLPAGVSVALRSGHRRVRVRAVEVANAGEVWREGFDGPSSTQRIAGVLLAWVALPTLLLLALGSPASARRRGLAAIYGSFLLLLVSIVAFAFADRWAYRYPRLDDALREAEDYFRKGEKDAVLAELLDRHGPPPGGVDPRGSDVAATGPLRQEGGNGGPWKVLFVGGSQTWGAGAAAEGDTWVRQTEILLRDRHGLDVECMNGGVSGFKAWDVATLLGEHLFAYRPDMIVINLGSNDRQSSFHEPLQRMVSRSLGRGARVVLVQEANSPMAADRGLGARHREMRAIAETYDVPVVAMHSYLAGRQQLGLLWWDKVHLTSFGQRLMADRMAAVLTRQLVGNPGGESGASGAP